MFHSHQSPSFNSGKTPSILPLSHPLNEQPLGPRDDDLVELLEMSSRVAEQEVGADADSDRAPTYRRKPATTIPLEDLLAQLDVPRDQRPRRDLRPAWLRETIDCITSLFEPLAHSGRAGFECRPIDGRWHVSFYLGAAEHVGGALDGHVEAVNFEFDVAALWKCFEKIETFQWRVFPTPEAIGVDGVTRDDIPRGLSTLKLDGLARTESGLSEPVTVEIHSLPPASSNVGLKLYANGDTVAPAADE